MSASELAGMPVPQEFTTGPSQRCRFPTVTAAISHHVKITPSFTAAIDFSQSVPREITYRELDNRARRLAQRLRALDVLPGDRVPLVVKRGIEMLVGIYAILLCGAQYVPLDGGVVADKTLEAVVSESGGRLALCSETTSHRFKTSESDILKKCLLVIVNDESSQPTASPVIDLATAESGCYVIYTSGTTGAPKGVDVTHKNVTNLVCTSPGDLGIRPGVKVGQVLNIGFDMAAWEILACLCNGGTLVLRGADWTSAISTIDILICTPSILAKKTPEEFPNIKVVATAGEKSDQQLADRWATHGIYYNCCGPTETTIVNTMHRHVPGERLTIGKPTPNNCVYILDDHLQPVRMGEVGTMWGGGRGISRGYIGLPEKTAERYRIDPFANDGTWMYNTGDLGRWLPSGEIDILGRKDDQVKVKGFRVELDGVAHAMTSAPGVKTAFALLIKGEIHGFLHPSTCQVQVVQTHIAALLPYYARPGEYHLLKDVPLTQNGKVDKRVLQNIASAKDAELAELARQEAVVNSQPSNGNGSIKSGVYTDSLSKEKLSGALSPAYSASTAVAKSESLFDFKLEKELPQKTLPKSLRNFVYRAFIPYRTLLVMVYVMNIGALISMYIRGINRTWIGYMVAINLLIAVLIRQDNVINALYRTCCSVPKSWPLWIRASCAKVYHLGGVHSSAASWSSFWLLAGNVTDVVCFSTNSCNSYPYHSVAFQFLSWMLSAMFVTMIAFAWPSIRIKNHDFFERWHRFVGWMMLFLFWVQTFIGISDVAKDTSSAYGMTLLQTPPFWILLVATLSIASSWFWLRRVPVISEVLSNHAVRLHFDYTVPVNGTFTRISTRPLLEWHSFATVPAPEAHGENNMFPKGYSLVVSNAGDWTKSCIEKPPTHLWVRSLPVCGVMRIATLFNRVVIVATGSGIGPLLGHIQNPTCATACFWSTKEPVKTFGQEFIDILRKQVPHSVIWNTTEQGRPDMVRATYNMAKSFNAEAVIIIANQKITKKVVYGLETRGVHAYGAIWDS